MERREFVAGVGGLAASGWIDVSGDAEEEDGKSRETRGSSEDGEGHVVVQDTVVDTARFPLRLRDDAEVAVEVDADEGAEFTVAVMSLQSMTSKKVTDETEEHLSAEIDADGDYIVNVTGEGRCEVSVVRV